MPIDGKYGQVTLEHGTVGADEPVVVFRAQDELLSDVLRLYRSLCKIVGSPPGHLDAITKAIETVEKWQEAHPTKTPDT